MTVVSAALIAVVLVLGVWIGICVSDRAAHRDDDLLAVLFAEKFNDDLDREAQRWRQ